MGRVRSPRRHGDAPVLITEAPISLDDQQAARRRKYAVMMTLRVICLLAAAAVARYSIWLALVLIAGGVVLPWCAVIIANDRPPRKAESVARYPGSEASARSIAASAIDVDDPAQSSADAQPAPDGGPAGGPDDGPAAGRPA